MARPIEFSEQNFTWRGWSETQNRPEVGDLPSFKEGDQTISCWRLTLWERFVVAISGRVWLRVRGKQPPVCVEGTYPFEREGEIKGE